MDLKKNRFSCGTEASRDLPELTLALLGLILPLLGVIWALLGVILDLLGLTLSLLRRSWGSPETLWGASGELLGPPKASQIAPGGSPGGPPLLSLILAPFWDPFWVHFGTPRTSKNKVFVWRVCYFSKNRGVRKKHLKMETWLSRNGKRVKSESRKHRKQRRRRGDEHKQRREEPRQSTTRHSREFLVRILSELSGSIPGKAAKACEPQRQPVALLGRYAPSPAV